MRVLRRLRAFGANIHGGWKPLVVLYCLDSFVLGQGVITFLVGWVYVLKGAAEALRDIDEDDDSVKKGLLTIAAYVALDFAVFGTLYLNNALAHYRAERVIVALDGYRRDHGRYPERLGQLVPQ